MTRNEAIEIECKKLSRISIDGHYNSTIAAANIDALIELGLLKVEEPYTPIFIYNISGDNKLSIDIRNYTFNITPTLNQNGDTIGLTYDQVQKLKDAIKQWEDK